MKRYFVSYSMGTGGRPLMISNTVIERPGLIRELNDIAEIELGIARDMQKSIDIIPSVTLISFEELPLMSEDIKCQNCGGDLLSVLGLFSSVECPSCGAVNSCKKNACGDIVEVYVPKGANDEA